MTTHIDLYYTMRSPYCYLATPTLAELVRRYDLAVDLKPFYPLAVSDTTFFEKVNPLWPAYLARDTQRIAERLAVPFRWPRPDREDAERLEATVTANRQEQLAAGHWGAPLFVHNGEIFFGQDRIDDLLWHLERNGPQLRESAAN